MTPKDIISHYGTKESAAACVGVSFSTISNWVRNNKIPRKMQLAIQTLTKNKLVADKKLK